jgi:hypothetical protein
MNPVNVIFSGTIISLSHELLLRNDAGFCDRDRVITRVVQILSCQFSEMASEDQ